MSADELAARDHLALALDVGDASQALELANELAEFFAVAKVGLELFSAAGPQIIEDLVAAGFKVFADLKLHDIPNTVYGAAFQLGRLGVSYATLHTAGGAEMLAAGVEGLRSGAAAGHSGASGGESGTAAGPTAGPVALGVTVLTSHAADPPGAAGGGAGSAAAGMGAGELERLLSERARLAAASGCGGVVCAAADIPTIDQATALSTSSSTTASSAKEPAGAKRLLKVVPGIRLPQDDANDQARVTTPAAAIAAGADLLVIGRTVTATTDPAHRVATAQRISTETSTALTSVGGE